MGQVLLILIKLFIKIAYNILKVVGLKNKKYIDIMINEIVLNNAIILVFSCINYV